MPTRETVRLLVCVLGVACGTAPDPASRATLAPGDASVEGTPISAPGSCRPSVTSTGNSMHVGAYCSPSEAQCDGYGSLVRCSIDLDPRGGNFCIKIGCATHEECGEEACCTGDPRNPLHACVPLGCLSDAGACPDIP